MERESSVRAALVDPLALSDAIVAQGERNRARARRRTYVKTVVRCASHSGSPEEREACLLRADGYYRVGDDLCAIEPETRQTQATDVHTAAAECEERRRKRKHLSQKFVDDDEARLLQRYCDQKCQPLVVDVYDRSLSTSTSEQCGAANDLLAQDASVSSCAGASIDAPMQPQAQPALRSLYCASSYACYVLQSLVRPSKTYVGITNDRFKRLRRHNGEIVGGAKATRCARPWRLLAFVDGFGADKCAALRFEWSMHHPRIRRLSKPWHGAAGRLHCARQLLESEAWCHVPLRIWTTDNNDANACAADVCAPLVLTEKCAKIHLHWATPLATHYARQADA